MIVYSNLLNEHNSLGINALGISTSGDHILYPANLILTY